MLITVEEPLKDIDCRFILLDGSVDRHGAFEGKVISQNPFSMVRFNSDTLELA